MIVSAGFVKNRDAGHISDAAMHRRADSGANWMSGHRALYSLDRGIPTDAIQPSACILPVIYRRGPAVAATMAAKAGNGAGRQRSGFATVIGDPLPRCETPIMNGPIMNGAESLVRTLVAGGVDVCFANPGTSEMHFVAALDRVAGHALRARPVRGRRHRRGRRLCAHGRRPAATLLHLGPGLANGLANLHNARRARNPDGQHRRRPRHLSPPLDAPLTADIEGWRAPFSGWVRTAPDAADGRRRRGRRVPAARTPPGQIATLILPADTAWDDGGARRRAADPRAADAGRRRRCTRRRASCARASRPADAAGGAALRERPRARGAHRRKPARAHGQTTTRALERGARPAPVDRIPYIIDQALEVLAGVRAHHAGRREAPVAFFAYPGKPAGYAPEGAQSTCSRGPSEDAARARGLPTSSARR